jgi:hypothetical protein
LWEPVSSTPALARAAELATKAAAGAPTEGRALYAALRALPVPEEPVARLWHAATLLREHRGDGHIAALVTEGIGGTQAHVLHALSQGIPAEKFGRVHHVMSGSLLEWVIAACSAKPGTVEDYPFGDQVAVICHDLHWAMRPPSMTSACPVM